MVRRGRLARSSCFVGMTTFSLAGFGVPPRSEGAGESACSPDMAACLRFRLEGFEGTVRTATAGDASRGERGASIVRSRCGCYGTMVG
jgi:hypothetical protein